MQTRHAARSRATSLGVALGYATVVLIWGTTWYAGHTQVQGAAPHVAAVLRLVPASAIFFAIARLAGLPLKLERAQMPVVLIQGLCFFGLNYIAVYTGLQYLTSGVMAVIFSVTVPFNIVVDRLVNGTRPRAAVVVAALMGVCGIALVFRGELARAALTREALLGAALAVLAAAIVSVGNVLASRLTRMQFGAVRLNAYGMAVGSIGVVLWGVVSGAPWSIEVTPAWIASYVYLLGAGSIAAFWIYMRILPIVGVVAAAYIVVLAPVIALGISALLEGLTLGPSAGLGLALLLLGHSLLLWRRRQPARTPAPADAADPAPYSRPGGRVLASGRHVANHTHNGDQQQ